SIKISDIVVKESLETDVISEESLQEDAESQISNILDGNIVIIGGIISEVSRKLTKNNDRMAFLRLEDLYAGIEVIIFPKIFEKYKSLIEEDNMVIVKGRISIREGEQPKILCEEITELTKEQGNNSTELTKTQNNNNLEDTKNYIAAYKEKLTKEKLYILLDNESIIKIVLPDLKQIFLSYKGNTEIIICTRKERKKMLLNDIRINYNSDIVQILKNRLGEENIKVK
ncbi:MAG: OB-fold nucleic acid binding domain-containing protein, partial [Bacillota bacterium]|nr:OB-fold nucleic acid binding domain-containing protein [Bacillota bacterium]